MELALGWDGETTDLCKDPWIPWRQRKTIKLKDGVINTKVHKVANLIDSLNGRWKEDLFNDLCEADCVEDVKKIGLPRC